MSSLKKWIYSFWGWGSKTHECAWCGQNFNMDYEPSPNYTPLCCDSCATCYFSKYVEIKGEGKREEKGKD